MERYNIRWYYIILLFTTAMMINSTKMTGVKKGIIKKFSLKKSENTQQELEAGYFPDASVQHNNSPEHCMFAA